MGTKVVVKSCIYCRTDYEASDENQMLCYKCLDILDKVHDPFHEGRVEPTIVELSKEQFITNTSIDRLTIMGNISYEFKDTFRKIVNRSDRVHFYETSDGIRGTIGKNVFFEVLADTKKNEGKRKVRIDFNPNSLYKEEEEFLKKHFIPCLKNVSPSRVDVAIDTNLNLADYKIMDKNDSRKTHEYRNAHGSRETLYIGSPKSAEQIRIYNKSVEQKKSVKKEIKDFGENEKLNEELEFLENNHWWRFEFQWKEDKWKWLKGLEEYEGTPFDNMKIVQIGYDNIDDFNLKSNLLYLEQNPAGWEEIKHNKRKKKKLKEAMLEAIRNDLSEAFIEEFKEKRSYLLEKVTSFTDPAKYNTLEYLREI